jgi:hypothetical protein
MAELYSTTAVVDPILGTTTIGANTRKVPFNDGNSDGTNDSVMMPGDPTVGWMRIRSTTASFNFVTNAGNAGSNFQKLIYNLQAYPNADLIFYGPPSVITTTDQVIVCMSNFSEGTGGITSDLEDYLTSATLGGITNPGFLHASFSVSSEITVGFTWD